ncbi:MAG: diguanylate cyclase response regulator [Nitrospinaceae bacterium]|nr:MAG: diguanylate cyclase response regulator [Nitrospinaceae bacterium]
MKTQQSLLKILIVDDGMEDRQIYKRHLTKSFNSNSTIFECETGQEGIRLCNEENPDCILLDYSLPDMDGLEFLTLLRERGYPGAVIMLTGQGSEEVAVEAMKGGALDYLIKNELSTQTLHTTILEAVNHNEMDEAKKWKTQALIDPLTQVLNRNAYDLSIEQVIHEYRRYKDPTVLVIADIDDFKMYNDNFGHKTGDQVLRSVAISIKNSIRSSDLVFRYGGEEFAIILKKVSIDQAKKVCEKIRSEVENRFFPDRVRKLDVTISLGATAIEEDDTEEMLFKRADQALYTAKSNGRNRMEVVMA